MRTRSTVVLVAATALAACGRDAAPPDAPVASGAPPPAIAAIVEANLEPRYFGLLGEPRVNVLQLNLAPDKARPARGVTQ